MFWTFHKMPVIYATYLSAFPTFVPADVPPNNSRSIFDVPLACWIQLCFVRLHRNKMTVITSETIVLYFNLITHWQSYTQKRIMNFEKKYVACVASVSSRVRRESWDESKKKRKDGGGGGEWRNRVSSSPLTLPLPPFFFCSCSNFRAVTRLETLATQAKKYVADAYLNIEKRGSSQVCSFHR